MVIWILTQRSKEIKKIKKTALSCIVQLLANKSFKTTIIQKHSMRQLNSIVNLVLCEVTLNRCWINFESHIFSYYVTRRRI